MGTSLSLSFLLIFSIALRLVCSFVATGGNQQASQTQNLPSLYGAWPFTSDYQKNRAPWNPNFWNFSFTDPFKQPESSYDPFNSYNRGNTVLVCPTVADQSADYMLSGNSTGYPAADIANEIVNNPDLERCLNLTRILPSDPPVVADEDFLITSNASCPFAQSRLWQYRSRKVNAMCWVIQGFQENVLFRTCLARYPGQCEQKKADNSYFAYSPQQTKNVNLCITEYERASLWGYCPSLPVGQRIVRDRVVYPKTCTPFSVPCLYVQNNH